MLSLSALARRLDISYPRARALVAAGELVPDFMGPHNLHLFAPGRIRQLRAVALAPHTGGRVQ